MDLNGVDVSLKPNVRVPLYADDHRRILHLSAIHEDITAVPSATVALVFAGVSIRTALSLLVPERVAWSLTAVCFISHRLDNKDLKNWIKNNIYYQKSIVTKKDLLKLVKLVKLVYK